MHHGTEFIFTRDYITLFLIEYQGFGNTHMVLYLEIETDVIFTICARIRPSGSFPVVTKFLFISSDSVILLCLDARI